MPVQPSRAASVACTCIAYFVRFTSVISGTVGVFASRRGMIVAINTTTRSAGIHHCTRSFGRSGLRVVTVETPDVMGCPFRRAGRETVAYDAYREIEAPATNAVIPTALAAQRMM
jgi:hypothetical protein